MARKKVEVMNMTLKDMMILPDEAKTKRCPFSNATMPCGTVAGNRDASTGYDAENMHPYQVAATRCVGSSCMAWRDHFIGNGNAHHGYCGLAGKP